MGPWPSNEQLVPAVVVPRLMMVNLAGVEVNSSPAAKPSNSARLTGVNLSVEEEAAWVPAVASLKLTTQVESVTSKGSQGWAYSHEKLLIGNKPYGLQGVGGCYSVNGLISIFSSQISLFMN